MSRFLSWRDWFTTAWAKNDLVHGLAIAVIVAALTTIVTAIQESFTVDWEVVLRTSVIAGCGFLLKALSTNSKGEILTAEPAPETPMQGKPLHKTIWEPMP